MGWATGARDPQTLPVSREKMKEKDQEPEDAAVGPQTPAVTPQGEAWNSLSLEGLRVGESRAGHSTPRLCRRHWGNGEGLLKCVIA